MFGNIELFIERAKQINQEIDIREYKGEEEESILMTSVDGRYAHRRIFSEQIKPEFC